MLQLKLPAVSHSKLRDDLLRATSMSLFTDTSINSVTLSFPMVALRWLFTDFSVLFECSDENVVIGRTQRILISLLTFGNRCLLACARAA